MMNDSLPLDIVGFDLDGTLLDTSGDLLNAVNHALDLAARPRLRADQIKPMIGGGAKHMLKLGLEATGGCPPEAFRPLYKQMLSYYEAKISAETRPFDGALAALDALDARGIKTAIVTNKFESLALKLLDELALRDRFVTVIGGDTMDAIMGAKGFSKPHRAPIDEMIVRCGGGRAVFIGDSIYDIMAAKNAGIPGIAVSFGFLLEPVEHMGADAVIDHYDALIPTLSDLTSRRPA
jgi:phosphoglycolate phosphatase